MDGALDLDFVVLDVQDEAARCPEPFFAPEKAVAASPLDLQLEQRAQPRLERWRDFEVIICKEKTQNLGMDIDKGIGESMLVIQLKEGPVTDFNSSAVDKVKIGDRIIGVNGVEGDVSKMLATLSGCEKVVCKLRRPVEFRIMLTKETPSQKLGMDVDHGSDDYLELINLGKIEKGDYVRARLGTNLVCDDGKGGRIPIVPGMSGIVVSRPPKTLRSKLVVNFKGNDKEILAEDVPEDAVLKEERSMSLVELHNMKHHPEFDLRLGDVILEANGSQGSGGRAQELLARIARDDELSLLVRREGEGPLDKSK